MTSDAEILSQIKKIVLDREPAAKIYLYGSRARGDARHDSDWDLLILLNTERVSVEQENRVADPLYDLEFDIGQIISPMVYSDHEWNSKHLITPLYQNIKLEGKLL